jgi:hypothetical protein
MCLGDAGDPIMTVRERLLLAIEQAPENLLEELLSICDRAKQPVTVSGAEPELANRGLLDLLDQVQVIQAQVTAEEWSNLPHDGAINHDHYLYGAPKVEE